MKGSREGTWSMDDLPAGRDAELGERLKQAKRGEGLLPYDDAMAEVDRMAGEGFPQVDAGGDVHNPQAFRAKRRVHADAHHRGTFSGMSTANPDHVLDALAHIPLGDEDLTPEELAELDRRAADLASGRVAGIPHADVQHGIEGLRRKAG